MIMKTLLSILFTIVLIVSGNSIFAQNVDPVDKNKIANGGHDFVSYFTDQAAVKGSKEFTHEINGVKYQFASAQHKDLFKNNP